MEETQTLEYKIKTRELMARLQITPMKLVRHAEIGVGTGYAAQHNEPLSLDTLWRIYCGLRKAGFDITFNDVVEIP